MLRGYQNFDALAVGALPVGWTNGAGGNYVVGVDGVSGSNVLTQSAPTEGLVCTWTAVASVAGNIAAQFDKIISVSGNTSNAANLMICSDTAGSAGYITALVWSGSAWVLRLFRSPGGSAWTTAQDQSAGFVPTNNARIYKKIDLSITAGVGTIRAKVWAGTPADEPAGWNGTFTDNSPIACKYVGVFAGINGGAVLVNADNFYIGDSGDTFNFSTIPVTDANLYFSHANTFSDGTGAMLPSNVNAGSTYARGLAVDWYVKGGFAGRNCFLWLDTTALGAASAPNCPRIKTSVDDGVPQAVQLIAGSTIVPMATGASSGNHTMQAVYYDSSPANDQWNIPIGVKVLGFLVDSGATSAPPPTIYPKRLTYRSDSIGRGYVTDGTGDNNGDGTHAVPWLLAAALGAELGNVSYGGLGWGVAAQGNLTPFFTPGNDGNSSWNKFFSGHFRLVSGLESPMPDDIVVHLGTNCYLNSISDATVTASVSGFLPAQRSAAPSSRIWIVLPFGGFKKSAIVAGYTAYGLSIIGYPVANGLATLYVCQGDSKCFLIDLGPDATRGLTDTGGPTAEAPYDPSGIHPGFFRNAQLAPRLVEAMAGVPVTPAGAFATQAGIEGWYGPTNVAIWSNKENNTPGTPADINAISAAITRAENYFNSRLRGAGFTWPLSQSSADAAVWADLINEYAGVLLFLGRGEVENEDTKNLAGQMEAHRVRVMGELQRMLTMPGALDCPKTSSPAVTIYDPRPQAAADGYPIPQARRFPLLSTFPLS